MFPARLTRVGPDFYHGQYTNKYLAAGILTVSVEHAFWLQQVRFGA
jgi:hypothetical protein